MLLYGITIEQHTAFSFLSLSPFLSLSCGREKGLSWMRGEMLTFDEGEDTTEGVEVAGGAGHTEVMLQGIVR